MRKRFVSIWFPHLSTDWFTLCKPQLKSVPFVLTSPSHGRMIITAANNLAQQKGIFNGMVLADARALYPQVKNFDQEPALAHRLLKRIAAWCIRFTPLAAINLPDGVVLDATGCSHLWGGDDAYVTDLLKKINSKGFQAKAAMADTVGAAWAVARYGKQLIVEQGKQVNAMLSLPCASLRLDSEVIEKLDKLGLRQVKHLLSIPQTSLRRRFGSNILEHLNQAIGTEEQFVEWISIPEPYHERLPCFEPIVTLRGIEIALQQLLELLCRRLSSEGKGLRNAILKCYRVDNKIEHVEISTTAASNNSKHLFHLFQLKLSSIEPDLGIELFVLEATKVEDYSPAQEQIWKGSGSLNNTALSELVDRICGRIGAEPIHRYLPDEHWWPERSFKKATALNELPATEWKVERPRPLQLLSPPQNIDVTAPVPDYPPMTFRYKGKLHKVIKADGPERLEQEWWIEEGQHRDYYVVEDEEGCRYWLFRSGHYDAERTYKWFIHGFFA